MNGFPYMKKVEDVFILPEKLLVCPICNNVEFHQFTANLRNTGPFELSLYNLDYGKGYICTNCGYRMDFFKRGPDKIPEKKERKTPTELKVKKKK
jgi:hypothetical protein